MLFSLLSSNSSEPVKTILSGNMAVCMCVPAFGSLFWIHPHFLMQDASEVSERRQGHVSFFYFQVVFRSWPFCRLSTLDIVPGQDKLKCAASLLLCGFV
jgi:hypothetical protein